MKTTILRIAIFTILLFPIVTLSAYSAAERGVELRSKGDLSHTSGKLGAYRALVIGINNYQDKKIPALKTAVHDAREFANLLQTRYGFQITLLLDRQATRQAIMDKMRDLAATASPDESVLIYYAGHGDIDRVLTDGWWVPADAQGGNSATYLDNMFVQRVMKSMKARHVLLVSDSCYSGTLFGESRSLPPLIDDRYYLNLYNEKSRWGMTSGNKTPVSDSGSEGHSIFAYQLIKALKKNEKPYLTTQELCTQIAPIIANNSEQQPLCSPVRDTGDQGGGFVFVASTTASFSASDAPSYPAKSRSRPESDALARQKEALDGEKQELERDRQEIERMQALEAERKKLEAERNELANKKKLLSLGNRPSLPAPRETGGDEFIANDKRTVFVLMETSLGTVKLELFAKDAPISVKNFLLTLWPWRSASQVLYLPPRRTNHAHQKSATKHCCRAPSI
ncbi:MAG: caspase family protein [Deltaproteobacteria bacterium]|nr:caspase family protein [Deltaproteobacteria bacterium]